MEYKYDLFISYSRRDTDIADAICSAFDKVGISYYIDRQGVAPASEFPEELSKAILESKLLLFLASENSYVSKYTNNEITFAFNEKEKGTILPYIIDDSELPLTFKFIFAGTNRRNLREHPIETKLVDDILLLLGKEPEKVTVLKSLGIFEKPNNDVIDNNFTIQKYDNQWDCFIEALSSNKIVPVIGSEFLVDDNNYLDTQDAHIILARRIAPSYDISDVPKSLQELLSYDIVWRLHDKILETQLTPSNTLNKILSIIKFPFVITTSFTPIVEDTMKRIWGEIDVVNNNWQVLNEDSKQDKPILCYMYGKADANSRFCLSDNDILLACKTYLSRDGYFYHLEQYLSHHYLLFWGHDYKNGIDSFMWQILRDSESNSYRRSKKNDRLIEFISIIERGLQLFPEIVINEINRRLEVYKAKRQIEYDSLIIPDGNLDVYISYASEDRQIAISIFELLKNNNIKAWFIDKEKGELKPDHPYWLKIKNGIKRSAHFMPIITGNWIQKQIDRNSCLRTETLEAQDWMTECKKNDSKIHLKENYSVPVIIKDSVFNELSISVNYIENCAEFGVLPRSLFFQIQMIEYDEKDVSVFEKIEW